MTNKNPVVMNRANENYQCNYSTKWVEETPNELQAEDQWLLWKPKPKPDGKILKVPYKVSTHTQSDPTDPANFSSFELARDVFLKSSGRYGGVGFAFTLACGILGIDLDNVYDTEGNLKPEAVDILKKFENAYIEKGPSENGFHIFIRAVKPWNSTTTTLPNGMKIEVFSEKHYLTVTGNRYGNTCAIPHSQEDLNWIYERWMPKPVEELVQETERYLGNGLDDEEILSLMFASKNGEKIRRLYDGCDDGYPGFSEADEGLIFHLAFWTGRNPEQIKQMFLDSPRGERDKCQKRPISYVELSIKKAMRLVKKGYGVAEVGVTSINVGWPIPQQSTTFLGVFNEINAYENTRFFIYGGKFSEVIV